MDPVTESTRAIQKKLLTEIENAGGAISLSEFMQVALYDPQHGYYTSGNVRFGANGDFYTSPTVSRLFGEALARYLAPALRRMARPAIVEFGPGDGHLALDILNDLKMREPDLYDGTKYVLLERSPALQQRQSFLLRHHQSRLLFLEGIRQLDIPEFTVIANEFFDAFPARRWRWRDGVFQEMMVGEKDGAFRWVPRRMNASEIPPIVYRVAQAVPSGTLDLPEGVSEFMAGLWTHAREALCLVFDYGDTAVRLASQFPEGTLRAQYQHRVTRDVFLDPGVRDLSVFVPIDLLLPEDAPITSGSSIRTVEVASNGPLRYAYFSTQAEFLMKTTFPRVIENILAMRDSEEKFRLQMQASTLINLEGIGGAMFALVIASPAFHSFLPSL